MKIQWLTAIFLLSFLLLGNLKSLDTRSLAPFFKAEPSLKLQNFTKAKQTLTEVKDQELLELWESMLTGRSAPLSGWMKESYKNLGLNHIFTPSGFHLSAVIWPFTRILKNKNNLLLFFLGIGIALCFVPGMGALKRMVLIKSNQKLFGFQSGFFIALGIDVFWGTFQNAPLSFTYSFLFLGVIYSGKKRLKLFFWIFLAQMMLAYFQNVSISPLLFILNPILSLLFGLAMPMLFLLAIPLWHWQLQTGIYILKLLQSVVDLSSTTTSLIPSWEINLFFILILLALIHRNWKIFGLFVLMFCGSLNSDNQRLSINGKYDFKPQGLSLGMRKNGRHYFEDGSCKAVLIRGFWLEKCSPRKGSRKLRKLSYL